MHVEYRRGWTQPVLAGSLARHRSLICTTKAKLSFSHKIVQLKISPWVLSELISNFFTVIVAAKAERFLQYKNTRTMHDLGDIVFWL